FRQPSGRSPVGPKISLKCLLVTLSIPLCDPGRDPKAHVSVPSKPVDLEHNAYKNKHQERPFDGFKPILLLCGEVTTFLKPRNYFRAFVLDEIGQFSAEPIGIMALDCKCDQLFAVELKPLSQLGDMFARLTFCHHH